MNFNPIRKHNFIFYLTGIPNFNLAVESLRWNPIDRTIDTRIRLFTDGKDLDSCLIAKNQGKFQTKLNLLDSLGNVIKTFVYNNVSMKKQLVEMACSYNADPNEVMTMNVVFEYETYKEI